jgi:hypothetical protein
MGRPRSSNVGQLVLVALLGSAISPGCATSDYNGRGSSLAPQEQRLLRTAGPAGGFRRWWRLAPPGAPGFPAVGLVKWDADLPASAAAGHEALLEVIREELGRVNQAERRGDEVRAGVTVLRDGPSGLWGRRHLAYEIVGRTGSGTLLWAAFDEIEPSEAARESLADSDDLLLARALTTKLKMALGL